MSRFNIHATTYYGGRYIPDKPHITIATKNPEQVEQATHRTSHGYTLSKEDLDIQIVKANKKVKADGTKDRGQKVIWPEGLATETVVHV